MVLVYHLNSCKPVGLGQAGMEIFFTLSGFLITKSLVESINKNGIEGFKKFAKRRLSRLIPALLIYLLVCSPLIIALSFTNYSRALIGSVFSLIGFFNIYQIYFDTNAASYPGFGGLWSLSLEEQFYILSAGFYYFQFKKKCKINGMDILNLAIALITLSITFRILGLSNLKDFNSVIRNSYLPHTRFLGFGFGVLTYYIITLKLKQVGGNVIYSIISIALIAILVESVSQYSNKAILFQWSIIPILTSIIIYQNINLDKIIQFLDSGNSVLLMNLNHCFKAVKLIGLSSYSIYLWHCLFTQLMHYYFPKPSLLIWASCGFISLITGFISWHYIEKKCYVFN